LAAAPLPFPAQRTGRSGAGGPSLNGLSGEHNLPIRWSTTDNIAWKLALPAFSASTPIVWGDRIFLNIAEGGDLYLWSVDRTRGVAVWKRRLASGNMQRRKQNMSSPSPVTDGRNVWVMSGTGILKAFDFDGKEIWARDIPKDYGRFGMQAAQRERFRRLYTQLAGYLRRPNLHPHDEVPVLDRHTDA
jgi:outer membrane protein assembly factor BamB